MLFIVGLIGIVAAYMAMRSILRIFKSIVTLFVCIALLGSLPMMLGLAAQSIPGAPAFLNRAVESLGIEKPSAPVREEAVLSTEGAWEFLPEWGAAEILLAVVVVSLTIHAVRAALRRRQRDKRDLPGWEDLETKRWAAVRDQAAYHRQAAEETLSAALLNAEALRAQTEGRRYERELRQQRWAKNPARGRKVTERIIERAYEI